MDKMDYSHIKNYLENIKKILFSKEENLQIISSIIERNILIKIENKNIQIKQPVVYIKTSPLVRNEIMIKKDKIIKDIQVAIPGFNISDLR